MLRTFKKISLSTLKTTVSLCAVAGMLSTHIVIAAPKPLSIDKRAPVNFQAKTLEHDDATQTVTALGDVEFTQGNKILRADKMVYHLDTDVVQAIGNISLLEEDGSVHFAEYVELKKDLKDGFIQGLLSMLSDNSRFTAVEAKRENGTKTTMTEATYTPCKVCEADPHPLWQIKAEKVVHDSEKKDVSYKNARFEFAGIPFFYTPIFSHSDPSVKRKTGFLRPRYGYSSRTGAYAEGGYYLDIAPDKDATLLVRPTALKGVLLQGQWRERFEKGRIAIDGGLVQSDRKAENGQVLQNLTRGHLFASGEYDIDENWRAGLNLKRTSDKEYLRLYDIDKANVLKSDVYAERFSNRDYTLIQAVNFQDVRLGLRPIQPDILPSVEHHMLGAPNSLLGGRWNMDISALGLRRNASNQKEQRGDINVGWQKQYISSIGTNSTLAASARGDYYMVEDRDLAKTTPGLDNNAAFSRSQAGISLTTGYPLVKKMAAQQVVVEPVIGVNVASNVNKQNNTIPNEDSLDTQLDTNNLFEANRFSGIDRSEDGAHITYGLKSGVYNDNGSYVKSFVGQSYRFSDNNNAFPVGSGLEDNVSDMVGQISAGISNYLNADYRFQLDNRNLAIHRHEVTADGGNDRFRLRGGYLYLDTIAGTGFTTPRQQALIGGEYRFNDKWKATASTLADLGQDHGLRRASLGFAYQDECFSFSAQGNKNNLSDASGESGSVIMLRVGFKNIGEFEAPHIALSNGKTGD